MGQVLVTGARRGIGKAIALALARANFDVAVADVVASEELDAVAAEIRALGLKTTAIVADISNLSDHARLLAEAEAALGPLTSLVNNAGVSVMSRGDLLDVTPESFDRCIDVNTRGTFFLTQAFARRLRDVPSHCHRCIISITSANAQAVSIARGEYCISKAGASMMSKLFASRLSDEDIGVYEIQPGFIETDMTAKLPEEQQKALQSQIALGHLGKPADIAHAVAYLASREAGYVTGQELHVNGGMYM